MNKIDIASKLKKYLEITVSDIGNSVDYILLEKACIEILNNKESEEELFTPVQYGSMINIVYDFLQFIDDEFCLMAVRKLEGNEKARIYDRNLINPDDSYYSKMKDKDGNPMFHEASVWPNEESAETIYLPIFKTMEDVQTFIHELAHIFPFFDCEIEWDPNSEILPYIFEKKLFEYLSLNGYEEDVRKMKNKNLKQAKKSARKLLFLAIAENLRVIKEDFTTEDVKKYILSSQNMCSVLGINAENCEERIQEFIKDITESNSFGYAISYVLGEVISTDFIQNYDLDTLKEYINNYRITPVTKKINLLGIKTNQNGMLETSKRKEIISNLKVSYTTAKQEQGPVKS